jgi:hypothetical protein
MYSKQQQQHQEQQNTKLENDYDNFNVRRGGRREKKYEIIRRK